MQYTVDVQFVHVIDEHLKYLRSREEFLCKNKEMTSLLQKYDYILQLCGKHCKIKLLYDTEDK